MLDRPQPRDRIDVSEPHAGASVAGYDVVQRIWVRRRTFLGVLGTVLGLSVIALIVLPVRYLATGSVIVAEQEFGNTNASAAYVQKVGDPADLESQLLVIRSPRVMRLAMAVPRVLDAATQECNSIRGGDVCGRLKTDSAAFIDYVQTRYAIGAVGRSRVINISYQSPLPEVAQTMANALINAFLEDQRSAGSNSREIAASYLRKELDQLDVELRDADAKIQAFRRNKGLARGATAPISSERLTSISQQLSVAEAAKADSAARLQEIKANQSRGGANDAPSVLASRAVADLKQQLTVISAQLASQSNVLGPLHPSLRALEREQQLVEQRLAAEVASIAISAQKTYDANDALVNSLRKQVDTVKTEVGSATSDEASIESMVRGTEIKRQQYADLYKRASELETERRVLLGSTRLVSLAELPNKPFFPKKIPFIAAGATIGLMLALVAALFGDRLQLGTRLPPRGTRDAKKVRATMPRGTAAPATAMPVAAPIKDPPIVTAPAVPALAAILAGTAAGAGARPAVASPPQTAAAAAYPPSELSVVTGAPILARLPMLKTDGPASPIGAILNGQAGLSLTRTLMLAKQDRSVQEALRQLQTALAGDRSRRRIVVTSPGSGEGKTFVTLALAQYLASLGRSVLAVECDLRAPKFEAALSLKTGVGLPMILRGETAARDAVMRTATPNLDVITAGAVPGSLDLLTRASIDDLMLWSQIYDVVLIDAPPPAAMIDVGVLAKNVDGMLLCMRSGRASIGEAVATTSAIKAAGGKILGIALTMVTLESGSDRGADRRSTDATIGAS